MALGLDSLLQCAQNVSIDHVFDMHEDHIATVECEDQFPLCFGLGGWMHNEFILYTELPALLVLRLLHARLRRHCCSLGSQGHCLRSMFPKCSIHSLVPSRNKLAIDIHVVRKPGVKKPTCKIKYFLYAYE